MTKHRLKKPAIKDEAVQRATGKTWLEWFRCLDKFPRGKSHAERAKWLHERYFKTIRTGRKTERRVNYLWWAQTITVTYEQARGIRRKHQTINGYQISANKTLPLSVQQLYRWIINSNKRKLWLKSKFEITTSQPAKSVRIHWPDTTRVDINLYAKGPNKSSIQLQHRKLRSQKIANHKKSWWKNRMTKLELVIGQK